MSEEQIANDMTAFIKQNTALLGRPRGQKPVERQGVYRSLYDCSRTGEWIHWRQVKTGFPVTSYV
jgi:hypothetical protein